MAWHHKGEKPLLEPLVDDDDDQTYDAICCH